MSGRADREKQYPREMIIEQNRPHIVLADVIRAVRLKDEQQAPLQDDLILGGRDRDYLIALMADACRLVVAMDKGQ